jgi:hypothetical protein
LFIERARDALGLGWCSILGIRAIILSIGWRDREIPISMGREKVLLVAAVRIFPGNRLDVEYNWNDI